MDFHTWSKRRQGGHALALMFFANAAGIGAAGLTHGWPGLMAALAASLALWLGPWPRLARAGVRRLDAWLFSPEPPRPVKLAHMRPQRRPKRAVDPGLPLYYRLKIRHGEHAAALAVAASVLALLVLAAAVWIRGGADDWGVAILTLLIGAPVLVSFWRPDVEWVADGDGTSNDESCESFTDDFYYHPAYSSLSGNVFHRDDDIFLHYDEHVSMQD